jgi:threonine dehydrogenase-like Zn-dependent dehydrogenase
MKAVVFTGERELAFMEFPDPTPGPGEVVLAIKASGMCGSDLKFYRASKTGGTSALGLGALSGPVTPATSPAGSSPQWVPA